MVVVQVLDATTVPVRGNGSAKAGQHIKLPSVQLALHLAHHQAWAEAGRDAVNWVFEALKEALVVAVSRYKVKWRVLGHLVCFGQDGCWVRRRWVVVVVVFYVESSRSDCLFWRALIYCIMRVS
jgi:hypothetical protein